MTTTYEWRIYEGPADTADIQIARGVAFTADAAEKTARDYRRAWIDDDTETKLVVLEITEKLVLNVSLPINGARRGKKDRTDSVEN